MAKYLYLPMLVVLLLAGGRPAGAVSADPALQRFFFTSSKYSDWVVRLNGRSILEIGTGELSDYVSLPAAGRHTLEVWGRGMGIPNGQELVWADRNFQAAPDARGIELFGDDGVRSSLVEAPSAPADKSLV